MKNPRFSKLIINSPKYGKKVILFDEEDRGSFSTAYEASKAYKKAIKVYFGVFGRIK
jgi:hypothetical protein